MKKVLMWVLTIFMALTAIVYFPSITSVIALIFAVIAAPIKPLQEFFTERGLRGAAKGVVLCVAFICTMITVPSKPAADPVADNSTPNRSAAATATPSESAEPVQTPTPTPAPTPEPAPEATPAPTPEPTTEPTPEPALVPASEPTSASTPAQSQGGTSTGGDSSGGTGNGDNFNTWDNPEQQQTTSSWVLNTSTMKVHYPSCSSVSRIAPQNYSTSNASLDELLSLGYSRCGRCF